MNNLRQNKQMVLQVIFNLPNIPTTSVLHTASVTCGAPDSADGRPQHPDAQTVMGGSQPPASSDARLLATGDWECSKSGGYHYLSWVWDCRLSKPDRPFKPLYRDGRQRGTAGRWRPAQSQRHQAYNKNWVISMLWYLIKFAWLSTFNFFGAHPLFFKSANF